MWLFHMDRTACPRLALIFKGLRPVARVAVGVVVISPRLALIFKGLRRLKQLFVALFRGPRLALIFKGFASLHAACLIIAYKCLTYINKLSVVKEKPSREWSTLEGL